MYSKYDISDPESVETTLSLTMRISEWRSLRDQILASPDKNDHPYSLFHDLKNFFISFLIR